MLVSEGLCITGSDDKFLRVWPLDFSDFLLEVPMNPQECILHSGTTYACVLVYPFGARPLLFEQQLSKL